MMPGFSLMDWNRLAASTADLSHGQFSTTRKITQAELRKHEEWMCIRGKVYDYTHYIPYHPGGAFELERGAGDDSTSLFEEFHPWVNVDAMFRRAQVGILIEPFPWSQVNLVSRQHLASQFYFIRFEIKNSNLLEEIKSAKSSVIFHVKIRTKMGPAKRFIERPYTPLIGTYLDPENDDDATLTILLKKSLRRRRPAYLSHAFCEESPTVGYEFEMQVKPCTIAESWYFSAESIGMICAGSGITPALQVLAREVQDPKSSRQLYLVWCNQTEKHIPLVEELKLLMSLLRGRLKIIHLFSRLEDNLDKSKIDFDGDFEVGRFDPDFLARRPDSLPSPPDDSKNSNTVSILICGSWEFENSVRGTMFLHGFPSKNLIRIPG